MLDKITWFIFILLTLKCLTIGSEFNLITWVRYGKMYRIWYFNRETFSEYLRDEWEVNEMADMTKARELMKSMHDLITYLNDDEISDIGKVLLRAIYRMEGGK